MYKSKLQELCQSKKWKLPEYTTQREQVPKSHCPRFGATVLVNASLFQTPHFSRSIKEAHNLVAKIAFLNLTGTSNDSQKPNLNEPTQSSSLTGVNSPQQDEKRVKDMARLYKTQLQIYAQKKNLNLPVYISEREGPPHATRFKSKVTLEGKTYESTEFFSTIKDAENAAAKAALMSLSSDGAEKEDPGFYKNLLQELAQREYCCLPAYTATRSGPSHKPIFVSTVKIHDLSFTGQEAKTKKMAEMYAAKVAYNALRERNCNSSGHDINGSSPKLLLPATEVPDKQIPAPNPVPKLVRANEGVHHQANEAKLSEVSQIKLDKLPFRREEPSKSPNTPSQDLSRKGVSERNEISPSSSGGSPASTHNKVRLFPANPNMRLPAGVTVMRKGDKWFAMTMDSSHRI